MRSHRHDIKNSARLSESKAQARKRKAAHKVVKECSEVVRISKIPAPFCPPVQLDMLSYYLTRCVYCIDSCRVCKKTICVCVTSYVYFLRELSANPYLTRQVFGTQLIVLQS